MAKPILLINTFFRGEDKNEFYKTAVESVKKATENEYHVLIIMDPQYENGVPDIKVLNSDKLEPVSIEELKRKIEQQWPVPLEPRT